jgi:hypothetical protein
MAGEAIAIGKVLKDILQGMAARSLGVSLIACMMTQREKVQAPEQSELLRQVLAETKFGLNL